MGKLVIYTGTYGQSMGIESWETLLHASEHVGEDQRWFQTDLRCLQVLWNGHLGGVNLQNRYNTLIKKAKIHCNAPPLCAACNAASKELRRAPEPFQSPHELQNSAHGPST